MWKMLLQHSSRRSWHQPARSWRAQPDKPPPPQSPKAAARARRTLNSRVTACLPIAFPMSSCHCSAVTLGAAVHPLAYPMIRSRLSGLGSACRPASRSPPSTYSMPLPGTHPPKKFLNAQDPTYAIQPMWAAPLTDHHAPHCRGTRASAGGVPPAVPPRHHPGQTAHSAPAPSPPNHTQPGQHVQKLHSL